MAGGVMNQRVPDRRTAPRSEPQIPEAIGAVVFGTLGVGWVTVRCPLVRDIGW
jgi:hypothetical protein